MGNLVLCENIHVMHALKAILCIIKSQIEEGAVSRLVRKGRESFLKAIRQGKVCTVETSSTGGGKRRKFTNPQTVFLFHFHPIYI